MNTRIAFAVTYRKHSPDCQESLRPAIVWDGGRSMHFLAGTKR